MTAKIERIAEVTGPGEERRRSANGCTEWRWTDLLAGDVRTDEARPR